MSRVRDALEALANGTTVSDTHNSTALNCSSIAQLATAACKEETGGWWLFTVIIGIILGFLLVLSCVTYLCRKRKTNSLGLFGMSFATRPGSLPMKSNAGSGNLQRSTPISSTNSSMNMDLLPPGQHGGDGDETDDFQLNLGLDIHNETNGIR